MEKIRILFINHTADMIGGASQSLKNLITNLKEKADIIIPKDTSVRNQDIKKFYGSNINKVYRCNLPYRQSIRIFEGIVDWIEWYQNEEKYKKDKGEIFQIIKKNDYDAIHLNSYVLYPLIRSKYPMYIHVREICNANWLVKKYIQPYFRRSHGIIYIDHTTKEALGVMNKCIVLNNPFDQRKTLEVNLQDARKKYHIQGETVFTYIAATTSLTKGLSFVASAFLKAKCKNARLMIVGPEKISKYAKYSNVTFTGNISQMEEIYAITDYVLRGDNVAAIGRTIYEGLYSGCNVIIPGNDKYGMDSMFECDKFRKNIFFYKLRDMNSLIQVMQERNGRKKEGVLGLSNVEQYVKQFKRFVL